MKFCKFSNCHKIFVFRLMSPEFSIIPYQELITSCPYTLPLFLSPICQELPFVMTGANGKKGFWMREKASSLPQKPSNFAIFKSSLNLNLTRQWPGWRLGFLNSLSSWPVAPDTRGVRPRRKLIVPVSRAAHF